MSAVLEKNKTVPKTQTNGYQRRLITVAEYDKMIEIGLFNEDERVELLNGEINEIMPKGTKHAALNDLVGEIFREILGKRVIIRNQNPIILDNVSEPEPDIVLAKPPRKKYLESHPIPDDILLVMEISDTTLVYDRDDKAVAYSRNGIQQYLLLNLQNETIEDYREPSIDGYQFKHTLRKGDILSLVAFPEVGIKVNEILVTNA